jgi:exosome complex exonuclease DIS3/RRP44
MLNYCHHLPSYLFSSFIYRDTYVEREPGEKVNDRNDRAIRVSVAWYGSHLMSSQADRRKGDRVKVILLTDDVGSKQKAENEGLHVATGKGIHVLF